MIRDNRYSTTAIEVTSFTSYLRGQSLFPFHSWSVSDLTRQNGGSSKSWLKNSRLRTSSKGYKFAGPESRSSPNLRKSSVSVTICLTPLITQETSRVMRSTDGKVQSSSVSKIFTKLRTSSIETRNSWCVRTSTHCSCPRTIISIRHRSNSSNKGKSSSSTRARTASA